MHPITKSKIFHDFGFLKIGVNTFAPYPKVKKKINDAKLAPRANSIFWFIY